MNRTAGLIAQIETGLSDAWLPRIYRDRILKMRTRAYRFPQLSKRTQPEIHHTLLGIELKVGKQRLLCPDLPTARYLSVFARLRSPAVAIPYDITTISQVADELESSWHRMLLLADKVTSGLDPALRTRVRQQLIDKVRAEIAEAGAGTRIPAFKQSTKQNVPKRRRQTA